MSHVLVTYCCPTIVLPQAGWAALSLWGWLEAHVGLRAWEPGPEEQEERLGVSSLQVQKALVHLVAQRFVPPLTVSTAPHWSSGWSLIGTLRLRA